MLDVSQNSQLYRCGYLHLADRLCIQELRLEVALQHMSLKSFWTPLQTHLAFVLSAHVPCPLSNEFSDLAAFAGGSVATSTKLSCHL